MNDPDIMYGVVGGTVSLREMTQFHIEFDDGSWVNGSVPKDQTAKRIAKEVNKYNRKKK